MIDPTAALLTAGMACLLPVLVMMLGTLFLGTAIGHVFGPMPKDPSGPLRAEIATLKQKAEESEASLAVSASIIAQRAAVREEEVAQERRVLEQEIASLNAQTSSLKVALAAARRPAPRPAEMRPVERVVPDPRHVARIAELERVVVRVPALLKEVDALRALIAEERSPKPVHNHVDYTAISRAFGKRVVADDLKLVEGIGPKIAEHLGKHGLRTWSDVAHAKPEEIRKVLDEAGDRFHLHDPGSWPKQCRLMVEQRWEELRKYQRGLQRAR